MTHASLFSGIGGPEVAATMLGWENLFHCEINEFGRKILDYWYPNSKSYEDITKTDFSEWRGKVDVLTGGFPCQPFSYAGKRRGADDDRYLWPFMFKAIDQIRPTWVVAENVAGITTMVEQGEVSEMGGQASIFEEVDGLHRYRLAETFTLQRICDDLESHGYTVHPVLVPACAVGAPHRRDRVFIVARRVTTDSNFGYDGGNAGEDEGESGEKRLQKRDKIRIFGESGKVRPEMCNFAADTDNTRDRTSDRESGRVRKEVDEKRENITLYGTCRQSVGNAAADTDNDWLCRGKGETRERRQDCGDGKRNEKSDEDRIGLRCEPRTAGIRTTPSDICDAGLQEERPEQPATRTSGAFPQPSSDTSCSGAGTPGESGCSERKRSGDNIEPEERGESSEWSYGFYELLRHSSKPDNRHLQECGNIGGRMGEEDSRRQAGGRGDGCLQEIQGSGHVGCGERWESFPSVSPVHRGNDGIPFSLDRLSIPFGKWRTESLKAYGNAIVPQVMYEIFRAIELVEKETN